MRRGKRLGRPFLTVIAAALMATIPTVAFGGEGDPPPVTEAPRNCEKDAFGAAPWAVLRHDVDAVLDVTSSVVGIERTDADSVGADDGLADFALARNSADTVVYTAFAQQEIILIHLAVAEKKSDKAKLRKRAENEDRLEQQLVDGFVDSGLDAIDLHTPILWSEFPLGGREAKDGRMTVDASSGPLTANVAVFTQPCGKNLFGIEVVALFPCGECAGGVRWILAPEIAQSLSYRLANL